MSLTERICRDCDGSGELAMGDHPCPGCGGRGLLPEPELTEVADDVHVGVVTNFGHRYVRLRVGSEDAYSQRRLEADGARRVADALLTCAEEILRGA